MSFRSIKRLRFLHDAPLAERQALNRWWYEGKQALLDTVGLGTDAAHVLLGIVLFLAAGFLLRRRAYAPALSLGSVAALQAVNEGLDALDWLGWTGTVNWREAVMDTMRTLVAPFILALVWAVSRRRVAGNAK